MSYIQLYYKNNITAKDWDKAYKRIESIVNAFPTKLRRMESYDGYSRKLDKNHFDLRIDVGTENERVSFYGDWMSNTCCINIVFYKDWNKMQQYFLTQDMVADENKSIYWYPDKMYENNGGVPYANGLTIECFVTDTEGALYRYAIWAIGIMLENLLPGKVFMILDDFEEAEIGYTMTWLKGHFNEDFNMPIHLDKMRLLEILKPEYDNTFELACRFENLYRGQHKRNITFALEHIGYEAAFEVYAEILSQNRFGSLGFDDVLNPWIAATQNLESSLRLITRSREILLRNQDDIYGQEEATRYDLKIILSDFLKSHILWTPAQRERLKLLPNNLNELETGDDGGLFGSIRKMMGYRVNICPIYATEQELFEAFMYHDPKNGKTYREIIDKWLEENVNEFQAFNQKMSTLESSIPPEKLEKLQKETEQKEKMLSEVALFIEQYAPHERPIVKSALDANPIFMSIDESLLETVNAIKKMYFSTNNKDFVDVISKDTKERKIGYIKNRIKTIQYAVHPDFEQWLEEEQNDLILIHLCLLVALKLYDRETHYVRLRLLWDRQLWKEWEKD